ncbi:hypothetical protein I3843_09G168200 [Carya illinoinensis]|nr:uncharacterized protein LOC122275083 [Carya illinoinensis]KAG2690089.1 hypothetical protein I3760_09G171400 [Carya illinoinensis]KAG7964392.1 hypothetical protein I3843_09G168200 [Carya illinoinensis]
MASAIPQPLWPLFRQHRSSRRFLISLNPPQKCTARKKSNNVSSCLPRLPDLRLRHYNPSHLPLPLCPSLLLPRPPLHSLLQPRSPPFRHSLPLMKTYQAAAQDSTTQPSTKTVRVAIRGRVQGVFYRKWTVDNANQLGLKGWVRNKRDGSVEALFSGSHEAVQEMEQRCRRGPADALVTGLDVFPCSDDPGSGFELKPTV